MRKMFKRAYEEIKDSQFLYEEDLIEVVFQKPISKLIIEGEDYGSLVKGKEIKIPRWAAKILEEEGYVKIKSEDLLKTSDVIKLAWNEERVETLCKLPEKFYPKLRELIKNLNESIKKNPTATIINEQKQVTMKALDLINCRIQKILRLCFERTPSKSIIDMLEPEENALFQLLHSEIEEWRNKILTEGVE
ncbi:MAG: hypothetical protein DSO09_02625 [Candidatus Methanomethylicota archaeon]|jgi:hypothetical protein|uniref:DNA replication complex GINS family protein n=1 Tax=Thermoproteota archaeon TaxID=2056631 RepID=A0A520KGN7_9CREN|nr:DNA replication complex GINS family protein [Candidatus Verstraetearchaeota archaeon]RZN56957.1 MAG: DNA replication complex GINS family protein [Candidatus Verstraetearchaeota archaeon]TDA39237.1 MAG: hypothetical protein DSO09_02625 [Candidatus Verstraetearchaeota archaeon]